MHFLHYHNKYILLTQQMYIRASLIFFFWRMRFNQVMVYNTKKKKKRKCETSPLSGCAVLHVHIVYNAVLASRYALFLFSNAYFVEREGMGNPPDALCPTGARSVHQPSRLFAFQKRVDPFLSLFTLFPATPSALCIDLCTFRDAGLDAGTCIAHYCGLWYNLF